MAAEETTWSPTRLIRKGGTVGKELAGAGSAFQGLGKITGAASNAVSSYFRAEADKEIARQRTSQAAVRENAPILHELDVPFIVVKFDLGTRKKPIPVAVNLTLLNLFGLGDTAERIYADARAMRLGNLPRNFSSEWDDIRTPRTERAGTSTNPPTADQVAAAVMTEEEKTRWNRSVDGAATAALARGDFGSAIGLWLSKK